MSARLSLLHRTEGQGSMEKICALRPELAHKKENPV
jgi:hypothetical protein